MNKENQLTSCMVSRMKVIASAGTDEKVEYLKSLGADLAFNYKKESYSSFLGKNKPFQVYWVRSLPA